MPAHPGLAFPQQLNPSVAPPNWRPRFIDYLYLGFTNAAAFSPTDVMPLVPWPRSLWRLSPSSLSPFSASWSPEPSTSSLELRAIIDLMQRITVTIEGVGWTDFQELELQRIPREGELVETKYGTCLVTHSESLPKTERLDGKIVCSTSDLAGRRKPARQNRSASLHRS